MWIAIILLSLLSGFLYRSGGGGDESRARFPWMPKWWFNTKSRDIGCAIVSFVGFGLVAGFGAAPWYIHLLCFLLLFGALTTYWDFLSVRFTPTGRRYLGEDNFWIHGFACGVAYVPYAFYTGDWWQVIARCFALAVIMGGISAISGNDVVEETGRGASIVATLPIL